MGSRRTLRIHRQSHSNLFAPLNPLLIIEEGFINFCRKLLNHSNSVISHLINFTISNNFSNINKNLIDILFKHSISYDKLFVNKSIRIKDNVEPNWKTPIITELLQVKDNLIDIYLNNSEIKLLLKNLCIFCYVNILQ